MTAQQEIDYIKAVKQDIQGMFCWQQEINKSLDSAIFAIIDESRSVTIKQKTRAVAGIGIFRGA